VNDIELVVVADEQEAAAAAAERLAHAARRGGSVVLTGGRTPEAAYKEVAKLEPDWSNVEVWWSDERCVPPGHELSNYALAKRALLDRLEAGPVAVHRIRGELGKAKAATDYDREVDEQALDLLLLGIGPDGHVASLFPNAPTLQARERVVAAEPGLEPFVDRVTMTLPTLQAGREILFLVTGDLKADAVRHAFGEEAGPETPASLVRARNGKTTAILDRAAAAKLQA
jgi:6-phosphogluconolactonase